MNLNLRFKIIFITVAILIFAIAATTLVSSYVFSQEYTDALQSRALIIGQGVQSRLNRLLDLGIPLAELVGFEKQLQDTVDTYDDVAYVMIVDLDGKILIHNDSTQQNILITDPATLRAVKSGQDIIQVYSDQQGQFYDVFIPILDRNGEHIGATRLGIPVEIVTEATDRLRILSGVVAIASLSIAVVLLIFTLSIWVTNPLQKLMTAIEQIRSGKTDLTAQVEIKSSDEIGRLSAEFNRMSTQLYQLINTLEEQVADRTQQLEALMQINQRLAVILDLGDLLHEVVILTKETFNYYHVQIYLLDKDSQNWQLAEGYGQAGIEMKRQGHHIAGNSPTSLIARAARIGKIIRVDNIREEKGWLPNPLLPDTYAEMAIPINVGNTVVGVLDVQADEVAGLSEDDVNLLRSLANQVAVAIRNVRLFEEVETALANAHALQERYDEQSWRKVKAATTKGQHLYVDPTITFDNHEQEAMAEAEQQVLEKNASVVISNEGSGKESLVAPINLRNKTIGALQLHAKEHRQWTEDDMALIEAVADQLSQTAENLRLFEEAQENAAREQTIREITDKLREASNLDVLLETAARELGLRLGARHTVLEMGIETDVNGSDRHGGPVETNQAEAGQQE